jgi:hypothetical protein
MNTTIWIAIVLVGAWSLLIATRSAPAQLDNACSVPERNRSRGSFGGGYRSRPIVRVDELQRLRTDRLDIQRSIGREFGAPEISDRIWPPLR